MLTRLCTPPSLAPDLLLEHASGLARWRPSQGLHLDTMSIGMTEVSQLTLETGFDVYDMCLVAHRSFDIQA